jgi:hypothetical protein
LPALNQPIGISTYGNRVWISERSGKVRVCDWYSRQPTNCVSTNPIYTRSWDPIPIQNAGQIVISGNTAYMAASTDNMDQDSTWEPSIIVCRDAGRMRDCEAFEIGTSRPVGLHLAFNNIWIGDQIGVTRCQLSENGLEVRNETCSNTPILGGVNGIWIDYQIDGTTTTAYLASTAGNSVTTCTVTEPGLTLTNCSKVSDNTFRQGPGAAGLDVFEGRLYTPLKDASQNYISVCTANSQLPGCLLGSWPVNPALPSSGTTNIWHSYPPAV